MDQPRYDYPLISMHDDPDRYELMIRLAPAKSEARDVSEKYGNRLGPGTDYNRSLIKFLNGAKRKGIRISLKNPIAPDGSITTCVVFFAAIAATVKALCGLLSTWITAKSGRKLSIEVNGRMITTEGISPEKLVHLARKVKELETETQPKRQTGKKSAAAKERSLPKVKAQKALPPGTRKKPKSTKRTRE